MKRGGLKWGHRSHVAARRGRRLLQRTQNAFDAQCKKLEKELCVPKRIAFRADRKDKQRAMKVKEEGNV